MRERGDGAAEKSDEALALLLLLAAVLVGCALLLPALSDLADFCTRTLALTGLPAALFAPLLKVMAIALVVRFPVRCVPMRGSALSRRF